jgi:hypothetical protein
MALKTRAMAAVERSPEMSHATGTDAESVREPERYLSADEVHEVLLDGGLPDAIGVAGLPPAVSTAAHIPLLVLTGLEDSMDRGGLIRALQSAIERGEADELDRIISAINDFWPRNR